MTRPGLLFHCQHSVGLGHLARSLAVAGALSRAFRVVLLNGGRMPEGIRIPDGVEVVNLPALGHDDTYALVSHVEGMDVEEALRRRGEMIAGAMAEVDPRVVLVELWPFGRKRFGPELEALAEAAAARPVPPLVLCSLRDILVNQRRDQARHDERAATAVNRWFDGVLVHSDPAFATLEESFRPETPLAVPVHHTGFVAPPPPEPRRRETRVLVSAGGGMVGAPLALAAARAAGLVALRTGLRTTVIAGPFLPQADLDELRRIEVGSPHLEVVRRVEDLCGHIARSAVSVSQCGYNTAMDILRAGRPAVVVPYSEGREDEQRRRAERLEAMGVVRVLDPSALGPEAFADAVARAAQDQPRPHGLDLEGAARTAQIVADLVAAVPA